VIFMPGEHSKFVVGGAALDHHEAGFLPRLRAPQ
jgi:hypothetical protein